MEKLLEDVWGSRHMEWGLRESPGWGKRFEPSSRRGQLWHKTAPAG